MKIKTYNAEKMGQSNKKAVLNVIRFRPGISRRDLAEAVNLDPSTVTKIIGDLQKKGLVREVGLDGRPSPGRPAIKLEVAREAARSLVIKISLQRTCAAFGYLDNSLDGFAHFQTPEDKSVKFYFDAMARHLTANFREEDMERVESISISVPGLVEWGSNILRNVPHMRWRDVDIGAELRNRLPWIGRRELDIMTVNEAKLGLLTEMSVNKKLEGMKNGVYIYISQGVGGALLIGEEIYHGSNNIAGELGHMTICPDGPQCNCGNQGCLETYISIDSMVRAYEARHSPLSGNFRDSFCMLMKKAEDGDSNVMAVLNRIANYMAIGIVNLINIYDPDFVMLGGMGSLFPDHFVEAVSHRVSEQLLLHVRERLLILKGSLDVDHLTLQGATLLAMNEFVRKNFSNER